MKKLALSLVLTLGVSGLALANNGTGDKDKEPAKKEVADKPMDCLVMDIYEFCPMCEGEGFFGIGGEFTISHVESGEACKGADGGVLFQLHHPIYINNC